MKIEFGNYEMLTPVMSAVIINAAYAAKALPENNDKPFDEVIDIVLAQWSELNVRVSGMTPGP